MVNQLDQIGLALQRVVEMRMKEGKACVVEIICTRELGDSLRRDVLSNPVRFLDKDKDRL